MKRMIIMLLLALSVFGSHEMSGAEEYEHSDRRDPFVPLVGASRKSTVQGVESVLMVDDVRLQGILMAADGVREAIINGEIMREGTKIGRVTMMTIADNYVTLKIGDDEYIVRLYE
ncbi:MAG: hypothetical protein PHH49_05425 [Candidatus Omnitrophica bacterium]|nr:hypothetical protein [Candidatus Omnitrophota bacterium]MDD5488383.1 hypothetical protein [Candidatus Omnitrophota bacterium]